MYPQNSFITLTYSDDHLGENRLDYTDFQLFMKRLRKLQNEPMGFFCTGEYGEKTKRKHWHAIVFNYRPHDGALKRTTDRGDKVFVSETLTNVWGKGNAEYGSVTFESAGYCARYAAKKLGHGEDAAHEFHPISKKSNKQAIGKRYLEEFWPDIFTHGQVVLLKSDGTSATCSIPRYYEKWLKEHKPTEWIRYVTKTKQTKIDYAFAKSQKELQAWWATYGERPFWKPNPLTRNQVRKAILDQKFKQLQENLKL